MVGACSAHKPGWFSLEMLAWACKGGKGRWRPLSDRGFETSVMVGVTAGAWLALAPPISPASLQASRLVARWLSVEFVLFQRVS